MTRRVIRTDKAPAPFQGAPYSQAIDHGGLVFVSGQLGIDPGGNLVEGGIAEQTEQVMQNLSAILEAAGTSLENVVKATIFLADLGDFQMILISSVATLIFAAASWEFLTMVDIVRATTLPDVDTALLGSFGIGQGAYLIKKAALPNGVG